MSSTPTVADETADPIPRTWDDVDRWLLHEARSLIAARAVPSTYAYAMHDGTTTVCVRTPPLVPDEADLIGRAVAQLLHDLQPDQILLTFPDVNFVDGLPTYVLQAMAGERRYRNWRQTMLPLRYDEPHVLVEPIPSRTLGSFDWTQHVYDAFDMAPPPARFEEHVRDPDAEYTIFVSPDAEELIGARLLP